MARNLPKKSGRQGASPGGDPASRNGAPRALLGNPANPRRPSRSLIVVSALLFLSWLVTLGVVASRL
jgi:hypothetical protein